jgi:hypothetical protein
MHRKIDYIKSCKANIKLEIDSTKYDIMNIELLRYHKIELNEAKIINNYFMDFISKLNLNYCYEGKSKIYLCKTEMNNVSRIIKYNDPNNLPNELKQYTGSINKSYICKITDENSDNPNKSTIYPQYFIDILFHDKSNEKQFLITNSGLDFMFSDDEIIIMPDIIGTIPITKDVIDNWNIIKNLLETKEKINNNQDIIYSFLYNISFQVFIKSGSIIDGKLKDYKYKDIFALLDETVNNIELLKRIRNKIYNFYKINFLLGDKFDPNMIDISVNADNKYNFLVINFKMYNPYEGHLYQSFVESKRSLKLENLIQTLESKNSDTPDKLSYFTRINKENIKNNICDDNYEIKYKQSGGDIVYRYNELKAITESDPFLVLFGIAKHDIKKLEILNEHNKGNFIHSYCSEFLLMEINDDKYEVSIKSITYKILKDNNPIYKDFNEAFWKQLSDIAINKPNIMTEYKYKENAEQIYLFNKLPAVVEIYVKKIDNKDRNIKIYIQETAEKYNKIVLPTIKDSHIDLSIIIHLLWKSEFKQIHTKYFGDLAHDNFHRVLIGSTKFAELLAFFQLHKTNIINWRLDVTKDTQLRNFYDLTKRLLKNAYLGLFIMDQFVFTKNYTFNFRMYDNNLKYLLHIANLIENKDKFDKVIITKFIDELLSNNNNIYIKKPINTDIFDNNFMNNLFEYIKNTSRLHILWYTPNFIIKDYNKFINLIDLLNILPTDITSYQTMNNSFINYSKLLNNNIIKLNDQEINNKFVVAEISNFYDIYKNSEFVYNIRHLDNINKQEIDQIVGKLYLFRKNKLSITDTTLHLSCHYHNILFQNIFHMHSYDNQYGKIEEKLNNYYDLSTSRALIWDKIKDINYRNKDMIIAININVNNKIDLFKELDNIMTKHGRNNIYDEQSVINTNKYIMDKLV